MAGFDPNLDQTVWEENIDFERTVIGVSVKSYNEGQPKLQLSRQNKRADGSSSFAKLGRLTKDEAEAILPLIKKALEHMRSESVAL